MATSHGGSEGGQAGEEALRLIPRPERRLIRSTGSIRYLDLWVQAREARRVGGEERPPLTLALVIDRSGSMQGGKLDTAKRAALAVVERLDERDRAAVVVYDDRVDVLQPAAPVDAALKARVRSSLAEIQARASTALHEGWLTGCHAIAADERDRGRRGVARCLLLTDGLANVGLTDPEQIAAEVAGVRERTGIGTSTFGIGADYAEGLLAPMAVAGGGQFHHLRESAEIATAFAGELGEAMRVVATQAQLEIEADPRVGADVVSQFWVAARPERGKPLAVALGDLAAGDERHVLVRLTLPAQEPGQEQQTIRVRLRWLDDGRPRATAWLELGFQYASQAACDDEPVDPEVARWIGVQEAERGRHAAVERSRRGDLAGARQVLHGAAERIAAYTQAAPAVQAEVAALERDEQTLTAQPAAPMAAKEYIFQSQRRSRGQKDLR